MAVPGLMRVPGASVILVNGMLAAYIGRGEKQLSVFLPEDEPMRGMAARKSRGCWPHSSRTAFAARC